MAVLVKPSLSDSFAVLRAGSRSNSDFIKLSSSSTGLPSIGASLRLKSPARNFRNHLSTVLTDTQDGPKALHNSATVCAAVSPSLNLNKKIRPKSSRDSSISTLQNGNFFRSELINFALGRLRKGRITTINRDHGEQTAPLAPPAR